MADEINPLMLQKTYEPARMNPLIAAKAKRAKLPMAEPSVMDPEYDRWKRAEQQAEIARLGLSAAADLYGLGALAKPAVFTVPKAVSYASRPSITYDPAIHNTVEEAIAAHNLKYGVKKHVPPPTVAQDVRAPEEAAANLRAYLEGSDVQVPYYHGTRSSFDRFKQTGKHGMSFASPDPTFASKYANPRSIQYPEGANVMKVHVRAQNPFNYENPEHVSALLGELQANPRYKNYVNSYISDLEDSIKRGTWSTLEEPVMQRAIRDLGHDSMYVREDGAKNIAVFSPNQFKSAIGNRGTYDVSSPVLNEKHGGAIHGYAGGGNVNSTPQGIASLGRGDDSMLVHMTPSEVAGLQKLAMAHGGSLTINPHTGLPEAGILSTIFPMALGLGLNAVFPGLGSLGSAAIVGGLGALSTGSLQKGLMAGLGAYGGAGMAESLANAGAGLNANANYIGGYDLPMGENSAFMTPPPPPVAAPVAVTNPEGIAGGYKVAGPYEFNNPNVIAGSAVQNSSAYTNAQLPPALTNDAITAQAAADAQKIKDAGLIQTTQPPLTTPTPSRLENIATGASNVFSSPSAAWDFAKQNPGSMAAIAAAPVAAALTPKPLAAPTKDPQKYYNYKYTPIQYNPTTGKYENGGYQLSDYSTTFRAAEGGTVSPNDNMMYPMSNLATGKAGFNVQSSPTANEVVGGYDAQIDPFTGAQKFAAGGSASKSADKIYSDDPDGGPYSDDAGGGPYSDDAGIGPYGSSEKKAKGVAGQYQQLNPKMFAKYLEALTKTKHAKAPEFYELPEEADYAGGGLLKQLGLEFSAPSNQNDLGQGFRGLFSQLQNQGAFGAPQFTYNPDNQTYAQVGNNAPAYIYDQTAQEYKQMAAGGIASLPEYAAGGTLLRGPGDGMSDDIPAVIKGVKEQRAALADGEFVIPADVVSHLGNGSTDAGARKLYTMMAKVRHARTGNPKQGKQIDADKFMPA